MPPRTAAVNALVSDEAHAELDFAVLEAVGDRGDGGEGGADAERGDDDAVGVDAHELGGVGVLRGGLHGAAGAGLGDEDAEGDHADGGGDEEEEVAAADGEGAEVDASALEVREAEGAVPGLGVEGPDELLEDEREADRGDERGEAGPPRRGR